MRLVPPASNPERLGHLQTDLRKALRLLQRSSSVQEFMLDADATDDDVALFTTPRPAFTIETEEEQVGALPGRIALRYLGVPAFSDRNGLSGGAVVTSYAARTHPLHAPAVMADVRMGRYIRDNVTGEWCIITRNGRDKVTRLQYMRVKDAVSRERICLTCSSDLFDAGQYLASVLFQCHDREWRPCPYCGSPPAAKCTCFAALKRPPVPTGLGEAAASVLNEGPASWVGKVRVTVCSNLSKNSLLDIDECMFVRSSYQPSMDAALAADMQRLAIYEKITSKMNVPAPIAVSHVSKPSVSEPTMPETPVLEKNAEGETTSPVSIVTAALTTEQLAEPMEELNCLDLSNGNSNSSLSANDLVNTGHDVLGDSFALDVEMEDSFLSGARHEFPAFLESAILPADPSTLPGGIEICMDGMDIEEDWCSSVTQHRGRRTTFHEYSSATSFEEEEDEEVHVSLHGSHEAVMEPSTKPLQSKVQSQAQMKTQKAETPQSPVTQVHQMPPPPPLPHPQHLYQPFLQQQEHPAVAMHTPMPPPIQPRVSFEQSTIVPKQEDQLHVEDENDVKTEPELQSVSRGRPLAPRPAGMAACSDGFIWQMGAVSSGNAFALAARLEAMEKERKAEERRKKNREAAARSNARKKSVMDGIKSEIREARARADELRKRELSLKDENRELKRKIGMSM